MSEVCIMFVQKPTFLFNGDNHNSLCENIEFDGIYWNGELILEELFNKQTEKNEFVKNVIFKWYERAKIS